MHSSRLNRSGAGAVSGLAGPISAGSVPATEEVVR